MTRYSRSEWGRRVYNRVIKQLSALKRMQLTVSEIRVGYAFFDYLKYDSYWIGGNTRDEYLGTVGWCVTETNVALMSITGVPVVVDAQCDTFALVLKDEGSSYYREVKAE